MPLAVAFPRDARRRGGGARGRRRARRAGDRARRRHLAERPADRRRASCSTSAGISTGSSRSTPTARTAEVRPGMVLERLNAPAAPARAVLPGRALDRQPLHPRRHGRQQLLRRPLARLRQDGRQRRSPSRRLLADGTGRPLRPPHRRHAAALAGRMLGARRGRARRDRGAVPAGAAPGRRLQPRRAARARRRTSRSCSSARRARSRSRPSSRCGSSPLPAHRAMGVCHFPSFRAALETTRHLVALGPDRGRARRQQRADPRRRHPALPPDAGGDHPRHARLPAPRRVRRREPRDALTGAPRPARRLHGRPRLPRRRRRGDRPGGAARRLGDARGLPQHHDVDARATPSRSASSRTARCRSSTSPTTPRRSPSSSPATAPAAPGTPTPRSAACTCGRSSTCKPAGRTPGDARDRRGGLRAGPPLRGLALRRARRRHLALGVPRAHVRPAPRARLRGGQGRLRPRGPPEPRQDRPARSRWTTPRCSASPPTTAATEPARPGARLVGLGRLRRRRRDVQQQRHLPQARRRRDVPELPRHPRRAAPDPGPRQQPAAGARRPARPGRLHLARHGGGHGALRRLQGLPPRMPDRRRHGADEDRVPAPLPPPPRPAAARAADRLAPPLRPATRRGSAAS